MSFIPELNMIIVLSDTRTDRLLGTGKSSVNAVMTDRKKYNISENNQNLCVICFYCLLFTHCFLNLLLHLEGQSYPA